MFHSLNLGHGAGLSENIPVLGYILTLLSNVGILSLTVPMPTARSPTNYHKDKKVATQRTSAMRCRSMIESALAFLEIR